MYFMIKEAKAFDKFMDIWEKVSNIIKDIDSELIYSKKYVTAKTILNTKEILQCFYRKVIPALVILIVFVYGKSKNYCLKFFLKKFYSF